MTLNISSVFTYDEDAGNYIQAVEAADQADTLGIGALEPAVRQAINNFVVGCKQDGIWDAIKASCILAGAKTLEGSFIDLKSATKILTNNNFADGTYVGSNYTTGDYDRKTGLKGDGNTKYLDSGRNNNADPQDSKHLSAYISSRGPGSAQYFLAGGEYLTNGNSGLFWSNGSYRARINVQSNQIPAIIGAVVTPSTTFAGAVRTASNAQELRVGGTVSSNSFASVTPSSDTINIFRGPVSQQLHSDSRIAFYSIGESLDLAKLDSRVTDLITAFGAAIP